MKILSLNVNNFGGVCDKPLLNDYRFPNGRKDLATWGAEVDYWRESHKEIIEKNVENIVCFIRDYDVVFLHEVDTNCFSWILLTSRMKEEYVLELANGINKSTIESGRKSISCAFIKNNINYNCDGIPNFSDSHRNVEIEIQGLSVIGIHMSYDLKDWINLRLRFEKIKKNVLIIGDLNVFDLGTSRREQFDMLLNEGAKDLWLEQKEDNRTPTANTLKRIDYALASDSIIRAGAKEIIHNVTRRCNFTDHAAISVVI